MENLEAIKLVQSGKELSFVEIQGAWDVFKENKNTNSAEYLRLKKQARQKMGALKEKMPQMDLQEIKNRLDDGVTFWHTTANFLDYSQSNNII